MKKILAPLLAVLTTHILSAQVQKPATDTLTYLPGRIPARTVQEISYAPSGEVSQKVKTDFIASSEETAISNIELNKTKGVLDVSKTGSATWSFNFNLPPGIAGLVPELGLHYNSNAGNGVAGYRWNISGISEIARITSTRFHDNNVGSETTRICIMNYLKTIADGIIDITPCWWTDGIEEVWTLMIRKH